MPLLRYLTSLANLTSNSRTGNSLLALGTYLYYNNLTGLALNDAGHYPKSGWLARSTFRCAPCGQMMLRTSCGRALSRAPNTIMLLVYSNGLPLQKNVDGIQQFRMFSKWRVLWTVRNQ